MRTKVAIACQGGGSQAAFTAGVFKALFENNVQDKFEIVSLSGTSGGAICAALIWYALKKGENPVEQRLLDFWADNSAQTIPERLFNDFSITILRLINKGLLPQFSVSPSSSRFKQWMSFTTLGLRSRFTNFQELLETHIDFKELASWGTQPDAPILMLGACNILSGESWKFNSSQEPITLEQILASCAMPNLFPAVEIGKDAYWDGIFSDNPPVDELINPNAVGIANIPQEIWVIKLNPTRRNTIPVKMNEILDRRNELEGNLSLFQNLKRIEILNDLFLRRAFNDEFLEEFYLKETIKIPKSFVAKEDKLYYIPFIEMSEDLQNSLDYESKLDRSPKYIKKLIQNGEQQGKKYLEARLS